MVRLGTPKPVYNLTVGGAHTYFVRSGHDDLWAHNAKCSTSGENGPARSGRKIHEDQDYGPGYEKEVELPSGRKPDAINRDTGEIIELKPNNPRAIRRGERQVQDYMDELDQVEPRPGGWSGQVVTY